MAILLKHGFIRSDQDLNHRPRKNPHAQQAQNLYDDLTNFWKISARWMEMA
jgi:hypothetical protein